MTSQAELEIKNHLRDYVAEITQPAKERGKWICPLCGSGTHANGTGAFSISPDGMFWKCFACQKSGSIFDLYALIEGIDITRNFKGVKQELADKYNIDITHDQPATSAPEPAKAPEKAPEPEADPDFLQNFATIIDNAKVKVEGAVPYLHSRGFNDATINRFNLGYSDANGGTLVIPYPGEKYYVTRSLNGKQFRKPATELAGVEPIFNLPSLYSGEPCFIVESQLDAISIEQLGGRAVALGGTDYNKLLHQLEERKPDSVLIVSLDNDQPGQTKAGMLEGNLKRLNIPFIHASYSLDQYPQDHQKDANDYLQSNPEQFRQDLMQNIEAGERAMYKADPLEAGKASNYLKFDFWDDINEFRNSNDKETGFDILDQQSGGLYTGFYVLGAISSLGKTTFAHQIADQLASAGQPVLFFSLEQSRLELTTKSLSRLIAREHGTRDYVASIAIRSGHLKDGQGGLVTQAIAEYQDKIAENMTIVQCPFDADLEFIENTVTTYLNRYQVKPVVIVDYLQIVNVEGNMTDKQKTDEVVRGLKKLQVDNKLTLIAISSVNRSNYLAPIDFESFKESGLIEYSADVIWGLQLAVMNSDDFEAGDQKKIEKRKIVIEAKRELPREIELKCLKNRYGISSYSDYFLYYPTCDYFEESPGLMQKYESQGESKPKDSKRANALKEVKRKFNIAPDGQVTEAKEL